MLKLQKDHGSILEITHEHPEQPSLGLGEGEVAKWHILLSWTRDSTVLETPSTIRSHTGGDFTLKTLVC